MVKISRVLAALDRCEIHKSSPLTGRSSLTLKYQWSGRPLIPLFFLFAESGLKRLISTGFAVDQKHVLAPETFGIDKFRAEAFHSMKCTLSASECSFLTWRSGGDPASGLWADQVQRSFVV